jgi:hypothetical protein
MKIFLKKKHDASDKDPLVVMMKEPVYFMQKVSIGGSLEVDEELGYAIMGDRRYKGLFTTDKVGTKAKTEPETKKVAAKANKAIKAAPRNKSLKSFTDKSAEV